MRSAAVINVAACCGRRSLLVGACMCAAASALTFENINNLELASKPPPTAGVVLCGGQQFMAGGVLFPSDFETKT